MAKNVAEELRKARLDRQKALSKKAKLDAMSQKERQEHAEKKIRLEQIRRDRIEREKAEARAIQEKIRKRVREEQEEEEREEQRRKEEAVKQLKGKSVDADDADGKRHVGPSKKRVRFEDDENGIDCTDCTSPQSVIAEGFFGTASRREIDNIVSEYIESSTASSSTSTASSTRNSIVTLDDLINMSAP